MTYDEFVCGVQRRAHLSSRGDSVRAIHAALETLAERIAGGEPTGLATRLPAELGVYLREQPWRRRCKMSISEFYKRVGDREGTDVADAARHARAVLQVLSEAVGPLDLCSVRAQLPPEYDRLFDPQDEPRARWAH